MMATLDLIGFGAKGWGGFLVAGALMTFAVTLASLVIGAVFGALVAAAKLSSNLALRVIGDAYTTVFRGIPELLVIYLIYFGGATGLTSLAHLFGYEGFFGFPSFVAGAVAVGVISGAYQAEVYRGSFLAVGKGEIEAARAVGMAPWLRFRRIIAPQVMRFAVPGLGNVWQLSLKDSALVSVTGLAELMRSSQIAAGSSHQYFLFYVVGGCLYLVLTSISNRAFDSAEARAAKTFPRGLGRS